MAKATPLERCLAKLDIADCWEWTGSLNPGGYAQLRFTDTRYPIGDKRRYTVLPAHRFLYEQLVGPIRKDWHLDHLCRNKPCCNPDHLEPVPPRVNYLRSESFAAMNARKRRCPRGHPYIAENTRADRHGKRYCKVCAADYMRAYNERRRARRAERRNRTDDPLRVKKTLYH